MKTTIDINELDDLITKAQRLTSLANAVHTSLAEGGFDGKTFEGAAYILWDELYDFSKELEGLSCQT